MVNVDWFQPFKHRKDISVGVSYMVIMNLPRSEGFKRKNVIIVGIIPALSKEPQSLNSFLDPLVDKLTVLWRGIKVKTKKGEEIRAALICCAADISAVDLSAIVQIVVVHTATSFSWVVWVKKRITAGLIAACGQEELRVSINKMRGR